MAKRSRLESGEPKKRKTHKIRDGFGLIDSSDSELEYVPIRRKKVKKHHRIVKLIIRKAEDVMIIYIIINCI